LAIIVTPVLIMHLLRLLLLLYFSGCQALAATTPSALHKAQACQIPVGSLQHTTCTLELVIGEPLHV
jgi:hypothetical protein